MFKSNNEHHMILTTSIFSVHAIIFFYDIISSAKQIFGAKLRNYFLQELYIFS